VAGGNLVKVLSELDVAKVFGGVIGGGSSGPGQVLFEGGPSSGVDGPPTIEFDTVTVWGEAISCGSEGWSLSDGAQIGGAIGAVWGAAGWLTGAAGFTAFTSIGEAMAVGAMLGGAVMIGAVIIGGAVAYFVFK
jgi:hypothetical protein